MTAPLDRPAEPRALAALDTRARDIFRRIVDSYLASGEPVGSRMLSRLLPVSLSPASVRNVMQDLEELGLIYAPHTSAGRLPTQLGLRFYVDALLEFGGLAREERAQIDNQVRAAADEGGYESALTQTTSLLSDLTRGAGVVLTSKDDVRLKQIEFVRLEPERALAVLVGDDGSVENRIVATPPDMSMSTLTEASNYLNAHARGRTLARRGRKSSAARGRARRTRCARLAPGRRGARLLGGRERARASNSSCAGRPICSATSGRGRSGTHPSAVRGSRDEDRRDRPSAPRRERRGREDLHRFGKQVVLAVGLLDDRRAVAGRRTEIAGVLGVIGPTRLNYARIVPMLSAATVRQDLSSACSLNITGASRGRQMSNR